MTDTGMHSRKLQFRLKYVNSYEQLYNWFGVNYTFTVDNCDSSNIKGNRVGLG